MKRVLIISEAGAGKTYECRKESERLRTVVERIMAIDALVALADERLEVISASIADADALWPDKVARGAILRLFTKYMSVVQLCRTLRWIKREKRNISDSSC